MKRWIALLILAGCRSARPEPPRPPRLDLVFCADFGETPEADVEELRRDLRHARWPQALQRAEALLESDRLVAQEDALVDPATFLIGLFSGLPSDFLHAYRRRFGSRAREVRSAAAWKRLFYCDGMDLKGDRLASELMDRGEAYRALEIWRDLLFHYPDPVLPKPVLAARAAAAASACGDVDSIRRLRVLEGSVVVGGREEPLAALLERLAASARDPAQFLEPLGDLALEDTLGGGEWRLVLRRGADRLLLFSSGSHVFPFLRITARRIGSFVLWTSGAGPAGLVDLEGFRHVWVGPFGRVPLPAPAVERESSDFLRAWADVRRPLLSHWHGCSMDQERADLIVACSVSVWICPCGTLTAMDFDGQRWHSIQDRELLPLPERCRLRLDRALLRQ